MKRRLFISGTLGTVAIGAMGAFSLWRPEPVKKAAPPPITVSSAPVPAKEYDRNQDTEKVPPLAEPKHEVRQGSWITFDGADQIPLVTSGSFGGALEVPEPAKAGLYSGGAKIGASRGAAIVAAHVDNVDLSPAAFAKLHHLVPGSVIVVSDHDQLVKYKTVAVKLYEQDQLPASLFGLAGPHVLHLVTCAGESVASDGPWRYRYNLIVSVVPF